MVALRVGLRTDAPAYRPRDEPMKVSLPAPPGLCLPDESANSPPGVWSLNGRVIAHGMDLSTTVAKWPIPHFTTAVPDLDSDRETSASATTDLTPSSDESLDETSDDAFGIYRTSGPHALPPQLEIEFLAKVLESGSAEERFAAMRLIASLVLPLSDLPNGSRLIQSALQSGNEMQKLALVMPLQGHVLATAKSPHGNFVLTDVVRCLSPEQLQFVVDELQGNAVVACRNRYASRALHALILKCPLQQLDVMIEALLTDSHRLIRQPFANFVMQGLLEHGSQQHRAKLVDDLVKCDGVQRHRIAKHVLQFALAHCCEEDKQRLSQIRCTEGKCS